jgi:hypothetical protein
MTFANQNFMKSPASHRKTFLRSFLALIAFAFAVEAGLASPNDLSSWKALAEGGAEVEIVRDSSPPWVTGQNTNALRITVRQIGQRFGIVCTDTGKGKLKPGQWYDFSFAARTDTRKTFALTVSLESLDGKTVCARTTLPEVGHANWTPFSVALHVHQPTAKYRMVITLADTGNLWLNDISLTLRKTTSESSKP